MLKPLSPIAHRAGFRFIDEPPANEDNPAGGGAPTGDKPADKTFTQAELNAIATREKNEGKASAERAIAEQLGVSIEEAKAIIKSSKDAADSKKTEADKDREAAAKEKTAAEADRLAAKNEVHNARLERAFLKEGIDFEALGEDKAKRLLGLVTAQSGASYDDVLADVKQIKTDFPALFGAAEVVDPKRKAPGSDPKGAPPKPNAGEDKYAAGAERAKARYAVPAFDPLAKK